MRVEARFLGRASLLKMIPTMHAWIITPTIDWKYSQSLCSRGDGKVDRRKQQNPSGSRTKTRYQCQECVAGFPKVTPWAVACFLYLSQTQAKHFPLLCSVFCLFFFTLNKLKKNYPLLLFFSCFMLCFLFLNIISTQDKKTFPTTFHLRQPSLETTNLGGIQGPMVQQLNRLNWISHRQGHSLLAFKVLGCWICRYGPRHNVRVPCSSNCDVAVDLMLTIWRFHLKAHDSDRLRTFFGCLTPAVTDRVLRLHAADQQFFCSG